MAVEIPVVINIDKAFADAAKRVGMAIEPLRKSVDGLTEDLETWTSIMKDADINSDDWLIAAKNIQSISEALAQADYQLKRYTSNEGSIKQMSIDLAELNRRWEAMGSSQKFGPDGKTLSDDAKRAVAQYKQITAELNKQGKTLQQIVAEEARLEQLRQKGIQSRRYEDAILNSTVKTIRVLQEQERILSDRLSRAAIGSGKYEAVRKQLENVRKEMEKAKGATDNYTVSLAQQQNVLGKLTSQFTAYISIFSLIRFAKQIRDVTGELEYQRVALGHLIQDEEYGAALFEKIKQQAVKSPFRIKELVTYTKQLAAYRIEQENLFSTMTRLADISAGLGVDMDRLILAYGQVRAASVLRGQELRQFTEAGIPLVEMLTEKMGELNNRTYETADIFKLISARAVPFSAIADIFEDLTDKGGMFYKMQETQAKTLQGRWEKLKDTFDIALQSIGESKGLFSFKTYNDIVLGSLELLAKNLSLVPKLIEGASLAWGVYYVATTKARIATRNAAMAEIEEATAKQAQTIANMRGIKHVDAYTAAMVRQKVATNALSKAFWKLYAAIIANPWGAALAAISGIAMAIFSFRKKTEDATSKLSEFKTAVEDLASAEKTFEKTKKLIDKYKELAEKTDRTEEESRKLDETMGKLQDRFPGMTALIDGETKSLEDNVAALRKKNEEQVAASRDEAKARLDAARSNKNKLQEILDEQVKERNEAYHKMQQAQERMNKRDTGPASREQAPYKLAEGEYNKALNMFNEIDAQVDETRAKISSLDNSIVALDKYLNKTDAGAKKIEGWREQLGKLNDYETSLGKMQLFTPQEIDDLEGVYDLFKKLKKVWTDAKESASGLKSAYDNATDAATKAKLLEEYKDALARYNAAEAERSFFGFNFKSTTGSDNRLSNLKKDISELTNAYKKFLELRKYMSDSQALSEIGTLFPQLKGWEPSFENTIEKLQDMRKKVVAQLARSPKDKTLLEMQRALDTEISNLKFDDLKKKFDDELKRIKDEIKRSETARSFYQDILGLTGDEDLAASMSISVYGSIGQDFKDRIKKELVDSLSTLDAETFAGLDDKIRDAFKTGDYKYLAKNIEEVPENLRATVQQVAADAEKFSADQIRTWIKELAQFKTYGEKRVQLAKQTAREIEKINASKLPKDQKDSLIFEYQRKEAEEAAKLQYEAFKDTPLYIHLFENLDAASTKMLTSMRDNLIRLKANWKDLDPTQLREMQKRIEEIDSQLAAKNPFKAIADGIREYREQTKGTSREGIEQKAVSDQEKANIEKDKLDALVKEYEAVMKNEKATEAQRYAAKKAVEYQKVFTDEAQETANASAQTAKTLEGSLKSIIQGADNIDKWTSAFSDLGSSVKNLMSQVLSDEDAEAFGEQFDGVMGSLEGLAKSGTSIMKLIANPADITAWKDAIVGIVDTVAAIFGASYAAKIRRANKAIEDQQRIIDNLERSYQRLEEAMDEAFGTDYMYNYRKELEIINAEVAAYRAQAAAERSKGKKADEDKALEYERQAEEAMERVKETTKETQSFFAGSDLASAAQDFSSAWLDAYREFGNTAGAIEDRMEEMVKNLVEKAALSSIVQNVMGDWYESLKGITDWNADTIAKKVREARELIPIINQGLNTAASELQAAGVSLRGTVGQFTGISRDYAAASEESINGLAAGVNTQNFFLQHLDMNVAAILSVLTGGASTAGASVTGEAVDPYKDQMLLYASNLPQMRDDLAAIRIALDRVIKPSGNKYAVQVQM